MHCSQISWSTWTKSDDGGGKTIRPTAIAGAGWTADAGWTPPAGVAAAWVDCGTVGYSSPNSFIFALMCSCSSTSALANALQSALVSLSIAHLQASICRRPPTSMQTAINGSRPVGCLVAAGVLPAGWAAGAWLY